MMLNIEPNAEDHTVQNEVKLWHRRLGQMSSLAVNKLINSGRIDGDCVDTSVVCDVCATANQGRNMYKST